MATDPARIRGAEQADAAGIAAIYAPYVTQTAVSFEEVPPDAAEVRSRMLQRPRLPWLVALREGALVGYCYAGPHRQRPAYRWAVDCSVYLVGSEQGRGTGRALYERLLQQLRGLGYVSAFAGISLPNDPSIALHQALGFQPVGVFRDVGFKHGAWYDVGWWQLALTGPPGSPPEPTPWPGG